MKGVFGDKNDFDNKGGMKGMGDQMKNGMVLVMSLWDDHAANMLWLDSTYPVGSTKPGAARGTCSADSGKPEDVEKNHPDSSVKFSNIKIGDIGTTFKPNPGPGPGPSGCPGGSLSACIGLCPSNPPSAFQDCVKECQKRCGSNDQFLQ